MAPPAQSSESKRPELEKKEGEKDETKVEEKVEEKPVELSIEEGESSP